jgi:hypothetical protein
LAASLSHFVARLLSFDRQPTLDANHGIRRAKVRSGEQTARSNLKQAGGGRGRDEGGLRLTSSPCTLRPVRSCFVFKSAPSAAASSKVEASEEKLAESRIRSGWGELGRRGGGSRRLSSTAERASRFRCPLILRSSLRAWFRSGRQLREDEVDEDGRGEGERERGTMQRVAASQLELDDSAMFKLISLVQCLSRVLLS